MAVGTKHMLALLIGLVLAVLSSCAAPTDQAGAPSSDSAATASLFTPTASVAAPQVDASERWIEVELAAQVVRLREGNHLLAEYACSTGVAISYETTTYPGVYQVQQMIQGPIENVPGVFVSDILIYDLAAGAGIHSMPMDKDGMTLDSTVGKPVTAGCVRVRESTAVFKFARLGTRVWIH